MYHYFNSLMRGTGADICCDFLYLPLSDKLNVSGDMGPCGCVLRLCVREIKHMRFLR